MDWKYLMIYLLLSYKEYAMTGIKEKISRLADTVVFGSLPEEQLEGIVKVLKEKTVPRKTIIFREGDPGDSFYIIHSGKIRVFLTGEDGVKTELSVLGPGDSFGEMALLTQEPRSTDIEAIEESHLFILTKEKFDEALKDYPDVFKHFIKHMSDMVRRDDKRIQEDVELEYQANKVRLFDFVFIGIVVLIFAAIFNLTNPNRINVIPKFYNPEEISKVSTIDAKESFDGETAIFIDARPSNFYNQSHIKGAMNLPLPSFEINYMYLATQDKEKTLIIYGRSIGALYDEEVARQLQLLGHENIQILLGEHPHEPLRWIALDTWKEKGYPVEGEEHD